MIQDNKSKSRSIKILLVEDDQDHCFLIKRKLTATVDRISIESAGSAEEAIERLRSNRFDMILSDYNLPGRNGIEMLGELRRLRITTPCILLTGQGNEIIASEAMRAGACAYFAKDDREDVYKKVGDSILRIVDAADPWSHGSSASSKIMATAEDGSGIEKLFRTIFLLSPLPTFLWRKEQDKLLLEDYNAAAMNFTGGYIAALRERDFREISRDIPAFLEYVPQAAQDKASLRKEMCCILVPGESPRHLSVQYIFVEPDRVLVHVEDNTEKIRAESALLESEEKYSTIVEHAREAVLIVIDGTLIFANRAVEDVTGYSSREIIGLTYRDLLPLEYHEMIAKRNRDRLAGLEMPDIYTVPLKKKDGSLADVEVSVSVINYGGRKATLAVMRDITERKLTEEALWKSRNRIWALMNAINDPLMLLDINGVVLMCNETTASRFKMPVEELIGKNVFELSPDDVAKKRYACRAELLKHKRLVRYEDENYGAWFDNYLLPVLDSQGNIESVAVYGRNVTDYKRAEAKMKEQNRDLKSFIYGISHDIKTPLVNIREYSAQLLKEEVSMSSGDLRHFIERINLNSRKAINLIKGLENYGRYTSREKIYETFNLGELIGEVMTDLGDRKESSDLAISMDEKWPQIYADRTLIYQTFLNLMENAMKYGGKNIEVGWSSVDGFCRIWVKDDGIGIEDHMKDKVFDLFTRSPRFSQDIEGAGIGLSIVKKAVEDHGGRVELESQVDCGSIFYIFLPMRSTS